MAEPTAKELTDAVIALIAATPVDREKLDAACQVAFTKLTEEEGQLRAARACIIAIREMYLREEALLS